MQGWRDLLKRRWCFEVKMTNPDCCRVLGEGGRNLTPNGDVGISTLPDQLVSKKKRSGFTFNVMVVGEPGMGKSTLMESLFKIKMPVSDPDDKTERLEIVTESIEEDNVQLDLKIISTQNYSNALDNTKCFYQAMQYIDNAFDEYLDMEWSKDQRLDQTPDPRVHLCLYMIAPSGRSVRSTDLVAMKELAAKVNLVPIIAKSDSILPDVIEGFKDRITEDLCENGVLYYEFPSDDETLVEINETYQNELPFALCGSTTFVDVGGKKVRGRKYAWGVVEIENDSHSQFNLLRDSIVRSNMDHLMRSTHDLHYNDYRKEKMMEIGYNDNAHDQDPVPLRENVERQLLELDKVMTGRSKASTETLMRRVNEKIAEYKQREEKLDQKFQSQIEEANTKIASLEAEKSELVRTLKEAEVLESSTVRKSKKKSIVFGPRKV